MLKHQPSFTLISNILFLIVLLYSSTCSISCMKLPQSKKGTFLQLSKAKLKTRHRQLRPELMCDSLFESMDTIRSHIEATIQQSQSNQSKYHFMFFTTSFDAFKNINTSFKSKLFDVFANLLDFKFYCKSSISDEANSETKVQVVVVKNGVVLENKKLPQITDEYISYILDRFELNDKIQLLLDQAHQTLHAFGATNNNNQQQQQNKASFIQKSHKRQTTKAIVNEHIEDERGNRKENRLTRFIIALFLMIIFSLAIFFIVKYSIDWATSSRRELNQLKEKKLREVTDLLLNKEFLKDDFDN